MDTTPTKQEITIKQGIPIWSILALLAIGIFLFFYLKGCKGDKQPDIVYVKADSALQEELRRSRDSIFFYKQYKWRSDIQNQEIQNAKSAILDLTRTIVRMESDILRPIVITDSADCKELVSKVNSYIDTSIRYRQIVKDQTVSFETTLLYERRHSESLKRLLDSCRAVIGVVAPAIKELKPKSEFYLGIMGATNLGYVFAGPEIIYKDKRDRMYRFGYGVGNSNPWYSIGIATKIKLKR
jgi:hypothetical protein